MQSADYQKLMAQLRRDEGSVRDAHGNHIAYRCPAGALTIGYGHNLDAGPVPGLGETSAISEAEAEIILSRDAQAVIAALGSALPWTSILMVHEPARHAALVNMAFNMGVAGLLGFKTTLELVRVGDYRNAAAALRKNRKWFGQVGGRAKRLAAQIETGVWQ